MKVRTLFHVTAMLFGTAVTQGSPPSLPAGPEWSWNLPIYETSLDVATPTGKFREFEQRLDALQDMGVGIIWFLPIFPRGGIRPTSRNPTAPIACAISTT